MFVIMKIRENRWAGIDSKSATCCLNQLTPSAHWSSQNSSRAYVWNWSCPAIADADVFARRIAYYKAAGSRRCAGGPASIDIGERSPAFPVTPPYVRVRIRRFGGLSDQR